MRSWSCTGFITHKLKYWKENVNLEVFIVSVCGCKCKVLDTNIQMDLKQESFKILRVLVQKMIIIWCDYIHHNRAGANLTSETDIAQRIWQLSPESSVSVCSQLAKVGLIINNNNNTKLNIESILKRGSSGFWTWSLIF